MMLPPSIMRVRLKSDGRRKLGLWLPLFLIWPLVLVVALLLLPLLLLVAALRGRLRKAFWLLPRIWMFFCAIRGLRVVVSKPGEGLTLYVV